MATSIQNNNPRNAEHLLRDNETPCLWNSRTAYCQKVAPPRCCPSSAEEVRQSTETVSPCKAETLPLVRAPGGRAATRNNLASKLDAAGAALMTRDPALAKLVARLGRALLDELHDVADSLRVAEELLLQMSQ